MKFFKIAVMAGLLLNALPSVAQKLEARNFKESNEMTARLQARQ